MELSIEKTSDGSPTLYRKDIDEHYHSIKGAVAESSHVYVDLGWRKALEHSEHITVFEVGFGTGLNAALTAMAAEESRCATLYTTIELYPLSEEMVELFSDSLPEELRDIITKIHAAEWNKPVEISSYFTIWKILGDFTSIELPVRPDVVYFDAFAPDKQPQMWEESIFRRLYDVMTEEAYLTTYCAKGSIRRMLNDIGFITERMPGPPGGKREVLRAKR